MPLLTGDKLGPYEILSPIGAGGMGVVYKALDSRLRRTVAIKVLPEHFALHEDVRRRFELEARTVASLNHPNICVLHDIGSQDDTCYLVMEYLEGETLAERLRKGPLPMAQALRYGIEIADALAQAHRKGVCHRDIKPGNIILTKAGSKLLDFGLAKRVAGAPVDEITQTADRLTRTGAILGTAPYMAPEQLEGKDADTRTDIFAFGAVLYEMVMGRRPFTGENLAQLTAAILERTPAPIPDAPMLNRLVMRCLAKDREERWQSAQDLKEQLKWAAEGASIDRAGHRSALPWVVAFAAIATLSAAFFGLLYFRQSRSVRAQPVMRTTIQVPHYRLAGGPSLAISADGTAIAYLSASLGGESPSLFLRRLDGFEVRRIPVDGEVSSPFFSPDGQWLAFVDKKSETVKKVRISGGPAVAVCEYELKNDYVTASWGKDNKLYFGGRAGIQRVSADGGKLEILASAGSPPAASNRRDWPQLLPDGETVLFTMMTGAGGRPAMLSLKTKTSQIIEGAPTSDWAAFVPSGQLITVRGRQLLASQIDLGARATTGPAIPVVEDFGGSAQQMLLAVSPTGSLVYSGADYLNQDGALVWVDRRGNESPILELATGFVNSQHRLSPDNRWVAAVRQGAFHEGIWKYDLVGNGRQQLNKVGGFLPVWRPDGAGVAFTKRNQNRWAIYWAAASGEGEPRILYSSPRDHAPSSWSSDGRFLAFRDVPGGTPSDILTLRTDGVVSTIIGTGFDEREPEFSPRGDWMAYVSNESGKYEVYVAAYPSGGQKQKVSAGGGKHPAWSPAGDELFYLSDDRMMAVRVSGGNSLVVGAPQFLFEGHYLSAQVDVRNYDVARDGRRFLMAKGVGAPKVQLNLIVNWFEELKRLGPGDK